MLETYGRHVVTHLAGISSGDDCGKSLALETVSARCPLARERPCRCCEGAHFGSGARSQLLDDGATRETGAVASVRWAARQHLVSSLSGSGVETQLEIMRTAEVT